MSEKKETEKVLSHYQVRFEDGSTVLIHADQLTAQLNGTVFEIETFIGGEKVGHYLRATGWSYTGTCDDPPRMGMAAAVLRPPPGPPPGYHGVN